MDTHNEELVQVNFLMPASLREQFREEARKRAQNGSELIRRWVRDYVEAGGRDALRP